MQRNMQPRLLRQLSAQNIAAAAQQKLDELQALQHTAAKGDALSTSSQLPLREPFCALSYGDDEAERLLAEGRMLAGTVCFDDLTNMQHVMPAAAPVMSSNYGCC